MQVAEAAHPGAGLPGPFQVGGLDGLGGGEQVGDLVTGAADRAPVADLRSVGGWVPFSMRLTRVTCWPVASATALPVSPADFRI